MVESGNVAWQKSLDHVSSAASKLVAKVVYWDESSSGWPSACENRLPLGM